MFSPYGFTTLKSEIPEPGTYDIPPIDSLKKKYPSYSMGKAQLTRNCPIIPQDDAIINGKTLESFLNMKLDAIEYMKKPFLERNYFIPWRRFVDRNPGPTAYNLPKLEVMKKKAPAFSIPQAKYGRNYTHPLKTRRIYEEMRPEPTAYDLPSMDILKTRGPSHSIPRSQIPRQNPIMPYRYNPKISRK